MKGRNNDNNDFLIGFKLMFFFVIIGLVGGVNVWFRN